MYKPTSIFEVPTSILEAYSQIRENSLFESIELVEERIDFLKAHNTTLDSSHDTMAKVRKPDEIIDHLATNADPTKNKKFTQWIVGQYKKKTIRQEDSPRIKTALNNFSKHKSKLDLKDINSYKSLNDLEDAVGPHLDKPASKKEEIRNIKSDGADLIHSENGLTVHRLKNKEAACYYGAGTKWCTAADEYNQFDNYHKDGPLYVVQHGGRKYQFHFESNQFMDEKDSPVDLHDMIKKHPELNNVKEFQETPHLMSKEKLDDLFKS